MMITVPEFSCREVTKRPTTTRDLIERFKAVGPQTEHGKALHGLATRMLDIFKDEKKPSYSNEAAQLSTILSDTESAGLLEAFINAVSRGASDNELVDTRLLMDLCYVLRNSKESISKQHLLKPLLANLHTRIKSADGALEKQYQLICTLATLLDAMVDIKISDVSRETTHEPLLSKLKSLRNHLEPRLAQAACYAHEALRGVPDDEGQWQALCRYSWMFLEPTAKIAGAISTMDPTKAIDATSDIFKLLETLKSVIEAGRDVYTASESLRDLFLQTLGYLPREKLWYGALRYSGLLIEDRALKTLKDLLPRLDCLSNESFWCGLYAQLEQSWKKHEEMRDGIETFIEWTLYDFPVQKSCPRQTGKEFPRFQSWIALVANTLGKLDWKKDQPPSSWRRRIFKKTEYMPTLEIFCKLEQPDGLSHAGLLDKAWSKCEKAQAFFAQVAAAEHYTKGKRLEITRVSGALLPMERCYINLAIIESVAKDGKSLDPMAQRQAELSLFKQLKVARPEREKELCLEELFNPRTLRNGTSNRPKRVLIRGRAGVGKTTLCKKIMHEFHHNNMWKSHFKHIFWVPLRRLKGQANLEGYLKQEYFLLDNDKEILVQALLRVVLDQRRTLLILDGLDEIVGESSISGDEVTQVFKELFARENIIVTSRPYAAVPAGGEAFDLELETIGFRPQEVKEYIRSVVDPESSENIEQFIERYPIIQGLVQIPIQLDALCFGWDTKDGDFLPDTQKTMTTLYQAIEKKLWRKDTQQLLGKSPYEARQYRELGQIKKELAAEVEAIETLGFYGLVENIIEFQPGHLKALYTQFPQLNDGHLSKMSFLRTSDTSSDDMKNYHFLHLTFQEFFAAQYFVRFWIDEKAIPLTTISSNGVIRTTDIVPEQFLRREKYAPRYNIMWRFVAGLLSVTNRGKLVDFMKALESEPRDVFGPAHLRILMHCFSEVGLTDNDEALGHLHADVERRLLRLFLTIVPNPYTRYASLAKEMEFPERLIEDALRLRPSDYDDFGFYSDFLRERFRSSTLPRGLVECLISSLHSYLPFIVGHFHKSFPTLALDYVQCPDSWQGRKFYWGLIHRPRESESLPEGIVNGVIQNADGNKFVPVVILSRDPALSIDARTFVLSRLLDISIPLRSLRDVKKGYYLPAQETLLSLLNHDEFEMRMRGACLSALYSHLDVSVLERLLSLAESEYDTSDVHRWIAEALINQQTLPNSVLQQALDFCRRENFADDIRLMPSCTILVKNSLLQDQDYEALFSNGSWQLCLEKCRDSLSGLLHRFTDQVLALLHSNDSSVVDRALRSMRSLNDLPEQIVESLVTIVMHDTFHARMMAVGVLSRVEIPANQARSIVAAVSGREWVVVFQSSRMIPGDVLKLLLPHVDTNVSRRQYDPVIAILRNQIDLPTTIIEDLLSSMESDSAPEGAANAAERVLRDRAQFYSMLPGLSQRVWQVFFEIWTVRSIEENLNFYVLDDVIYIIMPEGSWKVKIDTPEVREKLECGIRAAERRLRKLEVESCPPDLLGD